MFAFNKSVGLFEKPDIDVANAVLDEYQALYCNNCCSFCKSTK